MSQDRQHWIVAYQYDDAPLEYFHYDRGARQVRRLVVIDDTKRMCGIVALGDLAVEAHDDKLSGSVLEHISEPPAM